MAIEYVLNVAKKRMHVRVDGMSHEPCNLDQLTNVQIFERLPEYDELPGQMTWYWCMRCRSDHDAAT